MPADVQSKGAEQICKASVQIYVLHCISSFIASAASLHQQLHCISRQQLHCISRFIASAASLHQPAAASLHCRLRVPFGRIVCRPRPYARLQLRRRRLLSPRDRMQSAPVCGCTFVEVLVRTSSSRDRCRLASYVRASYDSVYIPISCRFRFVRISFSVPSFLAAAFACAALPSPPPSLSIVPSVASRPAVRWAALAACLTRPRRTRSGRLWP